jgi:hypothetical protein
MTSIIRSKPNAVNSLISEVLHYSAGHEIKQLPVLSAMSEIASDPDHDGDLPAVLGHAAAGGRNPRQGDGQPRRWSDLYRLPRSIASFAEEKE